MTLAIARTEPEALYDVRRTVLRGGDPEKVVSDDRDHDVNALHVAARIDDQVVGSASFYPSQHPDGIAATTYQLRYLAVLPALQREGVGAALMHFAEELLRQRDVRYLWANGRDTALAFYQATGWLLIPGSEHLSPETQLPHTVITKQL